jgi:hypothetical protein
MNRKTALLALAAAATIGSAQAQSIFPGGPRFDGTVRIVNLTGSNCPPGVEGQTYQAAFAAKTRPTSQGDERMSIVIPSLAGAYFLRAEGGNGTFAGADQVASGHYILDAYRRSPPNSILNLDFTPNIVLESTPSFTFRGTARNFAFQGCTATVRGNFTRRAP